jgi:hypothetical protein
MQICTLVLAMVNCSDDNTFRWCQNTKGGMPISVSNGPAILLRDHAVIISDVSVTPVSDTIPTSSLKDSHERHRTGVNPRLFHRCLARVVTYTANLKISDIGAIKDG